nr:MAG TPA: hypothetical protein [Caudoviricetes sp.]
MLVMSVFPLTLFIVAFIFTVSPVESTLFVVILIFGSFIVFPYKGYPFLIYDPLFLTNVYIL